MVLRHFVVATASTAVLLFDCPLVTSDATFRRRYLTFTTTITTQPKRPVLENVWLLRGGANTVADAEESDTDEDVEDLDALVDDIIEGKEEEENMDEGEEEDVEEVEVENAEEENLGRIKTATLANSAMKSSIKTKAKDIATKKAVVKEAFAKKLTEEKAPAVKKKRNGIRSLIRLPYIIRASLNPFTVFAMVTAYWQSLSNLEFGKQEASQELRSALEVKARNDTGSKKGKRKMKRGQAKTLSDLPALSS